MDFGPILEKILKFLPRERQTFLFSATMSKKIESLQRAALKDPSKVQVSTSKYTVVSTLIQNYVSLAPLLLDTWVADLTIISFSSVRRIPSQVPTYFHQPETFIITEIQPVSSSGKTC